MQSNPNYAEKTTAAPVVSEEDTAKAVENALDLVGKTAQLTALMQEDVSFVECSEGERASILMLNRYYKVMNERAAKGSS